MEAHTPLILAEWEAGEFCELESSLVYEVNFRLSRVYSKTLSQIY